jgi:hypothetical protein
MSAPWIGEMSWAHRADALVTGGIGGGDTGPWHEDIGEAIADAERRARAKALEPAVALRDQIEQFHLDDMANVQEGGEFDGRWGKLLDAIR